MDAQHYTMRDAMQELITRFFGPEDEPGDPADQTAKADNGKPKLTLVPRAIIYAIAWVRMYGCKKYKDPDNWKRVSVERYRDAAYRHFMAYLDDPHGVDAESGLPHLWHCVTNFAFLCDLEQDEVIKRIEGSMKE